MPQRRRTPARIIGAIISAAMGANGISVSQLSEMTGTHRNTILKDLREPEGMTMQRVWLYFTALEVPIDEGLQAFADSFSRSLIAR